MAKGMKAPVLILLYLSFVTLPLIVAVVIGGPPRPFRHELASALGILAYSMILAEFVLSGRFRVISRSIGMDVTMRIHQLMARTALAFALLHPFLYSATPSGGPRPWDPTRVLSITTDFFDLFSGIGAFLLLVPLVLYAIYRRQIGYSYEDWRLMHGLGALLIAGLLLHHSTAAGRYSEEPGLTWLWIGMTAFAAASLLWVYFVAPLFRKPWRVASVTRLSPRQWEIRLTPDGHPGLTYRAGQFAWLNIGHSAFSLHENPFSIASAPSQGPDVSFVIKELGDFTRSLGRIEPGTRAYLDAPYGSLTMEGHPASGVALIAGGVGIAPCLAILREMRTTGDLRKIRLIYGNRNEDQILYRDEMAMEDVTYVLGNPPEDWTGETGLIDGPLLDRVFPGDEAQDWLYILCGPQVMMDSVERHLIARGVPSSAIRSERFDYG